VQFSNGTNTAEMVLKDHNIHVDTNHRSPQRFVEHVATEVQPLSPVPLVRLVRGSVSSDPHSFPRCNKMSLRSVTDMSSDTFGTYTPELPFSFLQ
jgi:hypothetical protein